MHKLSIFLWCKPHKQCGKHPGGAAPVRLIPLGAPCSAYDASPPKTVVMSMCARLGTTAIRHYERRNFCSFPRSQTSELHCGYEGDIMDPLEKRYFKVSLSGKSQTKNHYDKWSCTLPTFKSEIGDNGWRRDGLIAWTKNTLSYTL